ncbi:MAG: hypothetical protein ACJ735_01865 [Actinomycetes bacterium]
MRTTAMLGLLLLAAVGCSGHHTAVNVYGKGTDRPLTVAPALSGDRSLISAAAAQRLVEDPQASGPFKGLVVYSVPKHLVYFGLARVTTALGVDASTGQPIVDYRDRLAWVGVFQLDPGGQHSCAGTPGPSASLPPLEKHYYEAELVDPRTGQQEQWEEDASGQVLRDCGFYEKK